MAQCKECGKKLNYRNQSGLCQTHYREFKKKEKIDKWLTTGDVGMSISTTIRGVIRDYIYDDQKDKCAICGMNREWNGKPINFVLDHIDGDASNNQRTNLRLVCPNCDSQLDTFKSKNKKSARIFRTETEK